jgi:peptidoglycan/LPS O-acetylase OafA/YrhL
MNAADRNYKIDFLRGVAILVVLILHFNISYHLDQSALSSIFSTDFIKAVASNGNYGVTMFFVISGFLITSTSLTRYGALGKIDPLGFYIFRFARIMPCLILVLSLIVLFNFLHIPIFQNDPNSTSLSLAVFSVLTFWHNVLMEKAGYFNYCLNIFWSLSVEEIFYLMFPLVCLGLKKTRFILLFWFVLIIISPIYRSHYTNNEIIALYGYFSCFDAIAMGCVAAIISQKIQFQGWLRRVLLCGAGLLIAGVYLYNGIMENVVMGVSLMVIGVAIFLISVRDDGINKNNDSTSLFGRLVSWFGRNSYELYLFHIIVLALMKEMVSPDALGNYTKLLWMAIFLSTSALVAGCISIFYSQPMNKKLRTFLSDYRQRKTFSPAFSGETSSDEAVRKLK